MAIYGLLALAGLAMVAAGFEGRSPVAGVDRLVVSFAEHCSIEDNLLSMQVCEANYRAWVFIILGVVGLLVAGVGSMLAVMSWRRAKRRSGAS